MSPPVELATVTRLEWRTTPGGGSVRLRTPAGRTDISFRGTPIADRLASIRRFRTRVSADRQEGWPEFCRRIALPLRRSFEPVHPLRPGERLLTRRGYDVLFGVGTTCVFATAIALWWSIGNARGFAAIAFFVPLWLFLRFTHPREGIPVPAAELAAPGRRPLVLASLAALVLVFPLIAAFGTLQKHIGSDTLLVAAAVGTAIVPFLPLLLLEAYYAPARRAWYERRRAESAAEWERLGAP